MDYTLVISLAIIALSLGVIVGLLLHRWLGL
jgi:hypothetical protein